MTKTYVIESGQGPTAEHHKPLLNRIALAAFYLGVIIEILIVIIDKSALVNPIEGQLFRVTFLLFLVKACLTKCDRRELIAIAAFLLLGVISYASTGRNEIIRIVIFLAACKDIDMERCLKLVFYMTLSGCLLIMLLSLFGIGGDVSLTQEYGRGMEEMRYTLGLGHPNALQCMVFSLTLLALYLYGQKWKWYGYGAALALNTGFFLLTDSKTSFAMAVFGIVLAGAVKLLDQAGSGAAVRTGQNRTREADELRKMVVQRLLGGLETLGVMACVGVSVWIAANVQYVYDYDWATDLSDKAKFFKQLDTLLTGRIRSLANTARWDGSLKTWSLFSERANQTYFDLGWIRLFYWYGIIPAAIIIAVILIWMLYCIRQKQYTALAVIACACLYTVFEAHFVSDYIGRNYLLFIFGSMWTGMVKNECVTLHINTKNKY